jgi:hypothetical protein
MKTKKLSKKTRLKSKTLIIVMFLLLSTFQGIALEKEKKVAGTVPVAVATMVGETETLLPVTTEILHNQLDGGTGYGITSQDFESTLNVFDSEAADDFEVPAGETWTIQTVTVYGFFSNAGAVLNQVWVRFYTDVNGLPAPSFFNQSLVYVNTAGSFNITLPQPQNLNSGRYWVSVQARMDYGTQGQWFWYERNVQYPNSNPSAWRNPGGGFGTPCTNWGSRVSNCGVGISPDLIFALGGTRTTTGLTIRFPTDVGNSKIEQYYNYGEYVTYWTNCNGQKTGDVYLFHAGTDVINIIAHGTNPPIDYDSCREDSLGMEVHPIAEGDIVDTYDFTSSGEGYAVVIDHTNVEGMENIYSAYWHITEPLVQTGEVTTDTLLGYIGPHINNPHLHLEIRNFPEIWIEGEPHAYARNYPSEPIVDGKRYFDPCKFFSERGIDVPQGCGNYDRPLPPSSAIDIALLIDTTASMGNALAFIKTNANYIMNKVEDLSDDYRVALIDYRDFPQYPYGVPNIDYPYNVVLDFSNNRTAIINGINSMNIGNGGDLQDSVYSGLIRTLQSEGNLSSWRAHANKYIIVLGDAPPHSPEPVTGYTFNDVMAAILDLANQSSSSRLEADDLPLTIQPIVIGNNPDTISAFTEMAEETGGTMVTAADASKIVDALVSVVENIADDITGENNAPDVSLATASPASLWPANNKMQEIKILNVVDPDGDPVTITITAITQDEPVNQTGSKKKEPDAEGIGTDTARVRAERDGNGNGRVYKIKFKASDDKGATAEGSVCVCVPHDQGEHVCIDDGQNYDSTSSK